MTDRTDRQPPLTAPDAVADSLKKRLWDAVGHASAMAWLVRLLLSSLLAGRAVIPSGFLENPFIPLTYFFGTLAATGLIVNAGKFGWRKLNPPTITIESCGGDDASLVLSPSVEGEYYGIAHILNPDVRRKRSFDLYWERNPGRKNDIRSKDKATIVLARIEDATSDCPELVVYGDHSSVHRESLQSVRNGDLPLKWFHIRTEFRSDKLPHIWNHEYRFRLGKRFRFEIEEVKPTTSHTVLGLTH